MTKSSNGLGASMWANGRTHQPSSSHHWDPRSRSLPPPSIPSTIPPSATPAPSDNLSASATASASVPVTGAVSRLSPAQAFHRFEQACHRLRWKFIDLQSSYQRAMAPEDYGFTRVDAERNFKVDFHEFYAWIEQAIVLLLLIFGVMISRGDGGGGSYGHAYHHNVLRALEDKLCPVYDALGHGDVIQALWKAKELRNRWKDAAEGRETPPLKMYDLTWIVTQVLGGLETAYVIAAQQVEKEMLEGGRSGEARDGRDEDEWEWMVESMDWEA
ncbi:Fc.00g074970.m01.CDS01 [Cosmosporella sp. VM-42]